MGKWDPVVKNLSPELPADSKFQDKVDVLKKPLVGTPASGLAQLYASLRDQKKDLEEKTKELNVKIAAAEQAMWGAFEDEGVSSLKLAEGGSVRIAREPVASVKDKDSLREWAMENGHTRDLTIPWQTLNAIAKSLIEAGEMTTTTDADGTMHIHVMAGVEVGKRTKTVYTKA